MKTSDFSSKQIAVIGLGFVGLPLSIALTEKGFKVVGIDVNQQKIKQLQAGESYIPDISNDQIKNAIGKKIFFASNDYDHIKSADVILICVPTPLSDHRTPDLTYVIDVAYRISPVLQKDQIIVLESSTYPGTTREVLLPILEKSGLRAGSDFHLGYSPERIDPGTKMMEMEETPKIVSGLSSICLDKVTEIYRKIYKNIVPVSSLETAEITKLLENTFRFINISFINEFAKICDEMGIDVWETIDAASTKPYGYTPFYPGPGIGGHCIPIDPLYLQWKISNYEMSSSFIKAADEINENIPAYIANRIQDLPFGNKSPKILLYGVTYKKDVNDIRDSKAVEIFTQLMQRGIDVRYHDPFVSKIEIKNKTIVSTPLTPKVLDEMDCIVILTDHSNMPLEMILEHSSLVFDTRNAVRGKNGKAKVIKLGGGK